MSAYRFLIPLALGAAAAAANYFAVTARVKTVPVVVLAKEVKPGEPLTADALKPVQVRMENTELLAAAVKFEGMVLLVGKPVRRPLQPGELLLKSDLEENTSTVFADLLKPGERAITVIVRRDALGDFLTPGGMVSVRYRANPGRRSGSADDAEPDVVQTTASAYRFLGTERANGGKDEYRRAVFAVTSADRELQQVADWSQEPNGQRVVLGVQLAARGGN